MLGFSIAVTADRRLMTRFGEYTNGVIGKPAYRQVEAPEVI